MLVFFLRQERVREQCLNYTLLVLRGFFGSGSTSPMAQSPLLAFLLRSPAPIPSDFLTQLVHQAAHSMLLASAPPASSTASLGGGGSGGGPLVRAADGPFAEVFAPLLNNLVELLSNLSLDADSFLPVLDRLVELCQVILPDKRRPICDLVW